MPIAAGRSVISRFVEIAEVECSGRSKNGDYAQYHNKQLEE
jgi:hypothetical protein